MAIFDALKTSRIELNVQSLENATYAIEGTDLIITVPGEQEAIVINNFAVAVESGAPLELVTNDGVVAELEELQAAIDASSIGEVAPAAGPQGGTGGTGGGAGFAPNQNEGIGEGLGVDGLLSGTSLDLGGETEGEALQPLIIESAASVETDPCNAMFEDKVAAFRDSFRSEPEFDNPNGFKYYQKDYIVSGDGNDPEHNSFDPSNSFDHGIDLTIEGSLSQSNDVMNASNIEEETHVIVGDEFIDENTYHYNGDVDASAEFIGNNQTVSVFNDNITGTEETIAIFGDTLIESQPYYQGNFDLNSQFDFSANDDETGSTNNNTMTVYGDEIVAGANTQTIAGDIGRATADWDFDNYYPTQIGISVTHSFSDDDGSTEARNNVYVANEDLIDASGVTPSMSYFGVGTVISGDALSGGTDLIDDNIYGGVQRIGETTGPLYISLTTEYTVSLTGDSVYSDNEMRSMNDLIIGSDGLDLIAGDALIMSDDMYGGFGNDSSVSGVEIDFEVDLQATGSVDYSYDSDENLTLDIKDGSTIENNKFSGHNDVIDGGAGADFIAGDVALMTQNYLQFEGGEPSVVTLDVDVSFDAVGSTRYFGSEEEQEGPFTAEGGIIRNNEINVFNDIIRGDDGTVQDGTFGDGMYGSTDFLVGDVLALDTNGTIIEFEASFSVSEAYNDDPQGTIENNTVNAWNDTLIGGAGNDIMVGDAMFFIGAEDNYIDIQLNQNLEDTDAEKQTEMSLFNDLLCGGDGNDMMFGDFSGTYQFGNVDDYDYNYASNTEPYEYELTFIDDNGQLIANMFNDTLRGDAGDDMLYGQLGDDVLVGGEGADTFVYEGSDNWEYSVEYTEEFGDSDGVVIEVFNDNEAHTDGHDTIQDFNHILEGDFINLDELFDNLGIWQKNDRAEQVNIEDNVITVEGIENFSITVQGDTLDNVSAGDNYNYDQLFDMGIDVGGIVLPVDVS